MLDLGVSKAALIGVVALMAIGPDRLPQVAKQVGAWIGRCRSFVQGLKDEMDRAVQSADIANLNSEVSAAANSFTSSLSSEIESLGYSAREAEMNRVSTTRLVIKKRKRTQSNQAPIWYRRQYTFKCRATSCAARVALRGRGEVRT
jgi:Tat protein translocase TatB subunit